MTYYVYKAVGPRRKATWVFVSGHEDLKAAEAAAEKLCPKREPISTEPGMGLRKAFFGSSLNDRWSAMITTTPERSALTEGRKP